ncbi:3'-5'-bisphosphate nucleotidase [Salinisphaera orenii MK-B5]|uniref:3'(2'),5'-bisphosphate nucleotidase CysQ n=2 Tax=Salinisphaera orenii TaxID=856731 RepID=A0A423PSU9_9GAMM|nr:MULTISPECIES: 3'(2'),5'-bisphosphate nucleotidase CysQ [Salinisphaera]ROO28677.1 3'-5'-bisphosphate nucleotidase [Salinisphaera orenii MK-B5]ROO30153.1 3'-5'-bisphosphate nucleotidase [Salinisphaera halophila YIM 95161]
MELTRDLLDAVCDIAVEAGQLTLPIYYSDFDVETKDDDSPLTQADLAAHRHIQAALTRLTPDTPQLSEEGAETPYAERRGWAEHWLVDPLDGTREFVNKNDQFTINIALIRDHVPVLGVVYAPVLDTLWFGAGALGAFCQTGDDAPRRIAVSTRADTPRVLVSRSHRGSEVDAVLARMPDYEPVTMGSSLKFCVIAEGRADFYPRLGPTSEWDTGAGDAVLRAAGGAITDLHGHALAYNDGDSILNPHFIAFGDTEHDWRAYLSD